MGIFKKKPRKTKVLNLIKKEYGCLHNFLVDIQFQAYEKEKLVYQAKKE